MTGRGPSRITNVCSKAAVRGREHDDRIVFQNRCGDLGIDAIASSLARDVKVIPRSIGKLICQFDGRLTTSKESHKVDLTEQGDPNDCKHQSIRVSYSHRIVGFILGGVRDMPLFAAL